MLKLERKSRDGQVNLLVNVQDRFFSRSLILAFAVALGIHVLFLLIFHVSPFQLHVIQTLLPPTGVEVDQGVTIERGVVVSELAPTPTLIQGIPIPSRSQPKMPARPQSSATLPSLFTADTDTGGKNNPFYRIEKVVYFPDFTIPHKKREEPVVMVVSGNLADEMHAELPTLDLQNKVLTDQRVVYEVRVAGRSGKIFWFEPKQLSNIPAVDRYAESLLRHLVFAGENNVVVVDGEIEFNFISEVGG